MSERCIFCSKLSRTSKSIIQKNSCTRAECDIHGHWTCRDLASDHIAGDSENDLCENVRFSRIALHATELGFEHPVTGVECHWEMKLPYDLQGFIQRLRTPKS